MQITQNLISMKTHYYLPLLWAVMLLSASCSGQEKAAIAQDSMFMPMLAVAKIPKAQGSYTDAVIGCALQDRHGNLWFGSNGEGIYRYNSSPSGGTFTHFMPKDGLCDSIIYSIAEDSSGIIWIGTQHGLSRYDGTHFTTMHIEVPYHIDPLRRHPVAGNPPKEYSVWSVFVDSRGRQWFGTDAGVYRYENDRFVDFLDDHALMNRDSLRLKVIYGMTEDEQGNIWFASGGGDGLVRYDGRTLARISPRNFGMIGAVAHDKAGVIWCNAWEHGVCRYHHGEFTPDYFAQKAIPNTKDVAEVAADKSGNLWISSYMQAGCLTRYNGQKAEIIPTTGNMRARASWFVLEDKSGYRWFGALRMGLFRYDGHEFVQFSEE